MAFWLNFVPNVGALVAVLLPMPVVIFDPATTATEATLAFALPLGVHAVIGNVLEPVLFGHSMDLQVAERRHSPPPFVGQRGRIARRRCC